MKKVLASVTALLLCGLLLCGCDKGEKRLPNVSYDNAPMDAYVFELNGDEAAVTGFSAQNSVANIPAEYEGRPVTTIRSGAFKGNGLLDTVNLPPSLQTIEDTAFAGCTKLRSVSLPASLRFVGDDAFYGCFGLTVMNFPYALNHIGSRAFSGCTQLETISFPDEAVYIGTDAFAGTPWLTKQSREFVIQNSTLLKYNGSREIVTVPNEVKVISAAFSGNESVKKVILPDTVTHLTSDAFSGCTALSEIMLGNRLSVVEDAAFSGCTALESVTFPASIKAISNNAFAGCEKLQTVVGKKGSAAETFAKSKDLAFSAA